jgi:ferredoxin, 2Fe-2S
MNEMPKVTYVPHATHVGVSRVIDASEGQSVMEAAVQHGVPGIRALCGGSCACATCHVYVDPGWVDRTGDASEMEKDMLGLAVEIAPNSRLSCQIKMTPTLDGLIVRMPRTQDQ